MVDDFTYYTAFPLQSLWKIGVLRQAPIGIALVFDNLLSQCRDPFTENRKSQ